MIKSIVSAVIVLSILLFGCSLKPQTVVGVWNVDKPGSRGNSVTYDFKPDGTFTFVEHAAFESIRSHQSSSGTYRIAGHVLSLNTAQEVIGIDNDVMQAIDARERIENPDLHIPQDKSDVPVKIIQPTTNYLFKFEGDKLKLKDISNYADNGVLFVRPR
jgi:hypothetical protein